MNPKRAILSDSNEKLIHTLQWVRDDPDAVHAALSAFRPDSSTYYDVRRRYNLGAFRSAVAAGAFLYINRHCFNGLWRTNLRGEFNVPYGGASAQPLTLPYLRAASAALSGAEIKCADFRESLGALNGEGLLVFADPPYSTSTRRTFFEYGPKLFQPDCLRELAVELLRLGREGARIVLTYCDDPLVDELFQGWNFSRFDITRNVGGFVSRRRKAQELLVCNFEIAQ